MSSVRNTIQEKNVFNKKHLSRLSELELYAFCDSHIKSNPELIVEVLSNPDLRSKILSLAQLSNIIPFNFDILRVLCTTGSDVLNTLEPKELFSICYKTAYKYPDITINILLKPELYNKFEDHWIVDLINLNEQIALGLYKRLPEILNKLDVMDLYFLCQKTLKINPELSVHVFSTSQLRNKLAGNQRGLIEGNIKIGIALYEKGIDFLADLEPTTLEELCLSTVKDNPEISLNVLNSKLVDKIDEDIQAQLISASPIIEENHNRVGERLGTLFARINKLNSSQSQHFNSLISHKWFLFLPKPDDQSKEPESIASLEAIIEKAENLKLT